MPLSREDVERYQHEGYLVAEGLFSRQEVEALIAEIGGGIAILAGVFGRWVSLSLVPLLLGTIVFAHGDKGWLFSNEGGGWEYPAFLAAAALAHGLIGDGAFALQDRLVRTFKIKALATT